MHYSINEQLQRFKKKRIASKDVSGVLQTRIWLKNLFKTHRIGRRDMEDKIRAHDSEPTGIVLRWLKGEHAVKESRVSSIASVFEGSDRVYRLPIFKLLKDKPLTKPMLLKIMKPYISNFGGFECWNFPEAPQQKENMGIPFPPSWLYDTEALIERGDIWGFTAILYLVRMAEAERNSIDHLDYMKCLYRALPGLCRNTLFYKRWRDTYQCVKHIHYREPTSVLLMRPRNRVLAKQIQSKTHVTRRVLRPRCPKTWRFTELELPYEEAGF